MNTISAAPKFNLKKYMIAIVFVLLVLFSSVFVPNFLSSANMTNIMKQVTVNGMLALGMTFVIITGGIDLSVGPVICLSGMVALNVMQRTNFVIAVIAAIAVGVIIGFINGYGVFRGMPPFIMTLSMMSALRGFVLLVTNAQTVRYTTDFLTSLGTGNILGIPYITLVYVVFAIVCAIILQKTTFGRGIYAIGGNEETARLCGINVKWQKIFVYVLSGFLVSAASILLVARLGAVDPNLGDGYEMDAIASVVVGGTSMNGGEGGIVRTIIGTLIIALIANILNLLNVSAYLQQVVKGLIIFVAVAADTWRKNKN